MQSLSFQIRSFSRPARLFLLATLIDGIIYSAWSLFFNFYILESGYSREFLGLLTSTISLSSLLLGIPMGLLSDRMGRKRAMILGVAILISADMLLLLSHNQAIMFIMAFLSGVGGSLYYLSQAPFMMKASTPENRTMLFSLNFGLVTLAGAAGSLLAGLLPMFFGGRLGVPAGSAAAYQAVLLASVLLSSLMLIPLALIREPKSENAPGAGQPVPTGLAAGRSSRSIIWNTLTRPFTLKLALPNLLIGLGAALLIPYMNVFFRQRFAISDQTLGLLFSLSALLTGIGSLVAPRLSDNLGSKIRTVVVTQGLSLCFLLMMGFAPALWMAAAAFLLRGTLMNMAIPLYSAFAMEQTPENIQGTVNSIKELAWQLGWVIGPTISGIVQEAYGFTPLFITTGILYGLSTLFTWVFFHNEDAPTRLQTATAI